MDPIVPAPPPLQDDMGEATLDDDSSERRVAELLSSPQAAKKSPRQREAQRTNLFILRIYKKILTRMSQDKADPGASARSAALVRGDEVMDPIDPTGLQDDMRSVDDSRSGCQTNYFLRLGTPPKSTFVFLPSKRARVLSGRP